MKPGGQMDRLLRFLREHENATSLEITIALGIVNTTGRISDLRSEGYVIVCNRRTDGREGYRVVEPGQGVLWSEAS